MHEELIARVEYLETRIAFQDHTIEQLSLELAAQQKQQEKLRLQLDVVIQAARGGQLAGRQSGRRDSTPPLLRSSSHGVFPKPARQKKRRSQASPFFLNPLGSPLVNLRVEHIAQPVPQQVDDQHQHHQT